MDKSKSSVQHHREDLPDKRVIKMGECPEIIRSAVGILDELLEKNTER
jgi:hypothetical protein